MYATVREAANPDAPQCTKNMVEPIKIQAHKVLLKNPHQRRLLAVRTRARPALNVMMDVQKIIRENVTWKLRVA
jgi:hypothetical protein